VNGENLRQLSHAERARRIGLIPQIHTPTFSYTVEEMVMMGRAPHLGWLGSPSRKDHSIVEDVMAQVGIYELRGRPYTEISGGEQQLTLIAIGLAQQSPILLMDEPTAHLDLSNQHRVLEIVQQLCDQGLSFIISSHSPNNALAYADRVLMLTGGWVTAAGTPEDTLTSTLLSSVYGVQTEVLYENQGESKTPIAVITQRPITLLSESLKDPNSLLSDLFNQSKDSPQLILLTGLSGVGKTTWCSQLVDLARERGLSVGGVISPSDFKEGRKVGINIVDLQSGETRQLASLRKGDSGKIGTPRWSFDPEVTAWANHVLEEAAPSDLLVMDEIGPLELLQGEGITAGLRRLDTGDYKVACVVIRTSLLPNALQRWPHATVVKASLSES
jgi:iron complex transport system ATP-binding protein